jgi:hypothetical protein
MTSLAREEPSGSADDLEVLWDFLAMAAFEPHAKAAKAVP